MEHQAPSLDPKHRLLCSYGGRIMSLPPANSLHYIGGEARLVVVPRDISFHGFFELLSGKLLSGGSFSLKYRLPGCDLDSLFTVSDNDDLQNMIAEHDSTRFRRIRLFLFPLNYSEPTRSESTRHSVSVKQLLGLDSSVQKISITSSSSVLHNPIFRPNNDPVITDKFDATAEDNRIQAESPTTSASLLPLENTAGDAGGVSDKETEKVEIQDQLRSIVQEAMRQQRLLPIIYCVPMWAMQPHMVTHQVAAYALSSATEHSSWLDPMSRNQENGTSR